MLLLTLITPSHASNTHEQACAKRDVDDSQVTESIETPRCHGSKSTLAEVVAAAGTDLGPVDTQGASFSSSSANHAPGVSSGSSSSLGSRCNASKAAGIAEMKGLGRRADNAADEDFEDFLPEPAAYWVEDVFCTKMVLIPNRLGLFLNRALS